MNCNRSKPIQQLEAFRGIGEIFKLCLSLKCMLQTKQNHKEKGNHSTWINFNNTDIRVEYRQAETCAHVHANAHTRTRAHTHARTHTHSCLFKQTIQKFSRSCVQDNTVLISHWCYQLKQELMLQCSPTSKHQRRKHGHSIPHHPRKYQNVIIQPEVSWKTFS